MTSYFNEMYHGAGLREPYRGLEPWSVDMPAGKRRAKQAEAEALFRRIGITFAVYGHCLNLVKKKQKIKIRHQH